MLPLAIFMAFSMPNPWEFILSTPASAISIAGDGGIAVGQDDGTVSIYDFDPGWISLKLRAMFRERGPIRALEFSPNGTYLATGFQDDGRNVTTAIWTRGGKLTRYFDAFEGHPVKAGGFNRGFALKTTSRLSWSPDGTLLAAEHEGHLDTGVRVWNMNGTLRSELGRSKDGWQSLPKDERLSMAAGVKAVAFSPGGTEILTAMDDGFVRTWHLNGRVKWQSKVAPVDGACDAAYSVDGKHVVFGTSWQDSLIGSLDAATGKVEWKAKLPESPMSVSSLRNGKLIVAFGKRIETGRRVPLHDLFNSDRRYIFFTIDRQRKTIIVSMGGRKYYRYTSLD